MQIASVLFVSCAVLSLGSFLNVGGHSTHVPLPFWIVSHTPFLNNLLPVRISFEMCACLAGIFAFALDDLRQTSRSIRKSATNSTTRPFAAALATGVVLVVLIATQLPRWPYGSNEAPMLPKTLSTAIPKGDPVALTYPYAYGSRSTLPLLWQASERYSFRILGGYSFHPAGHGHGSAIPNALYPNDLQVFLTFSEFWNTPVEKFILGKYTPSAPPPVTPNLVAATRTFLSKYHVQVIIVDRNYWQSMGAMKLFRHDLGEPTVSEGAFSMWNISKDSSRR